MRTALLLAVTIVAVVTGSVHRCHVCKTVNAAEVFVNLHCDEIPNTAPECGQRSAVGSRRSDFLQNCPEHSNCLTITKQDEEVRMCTQKQRLETIKTTDGLIIEVCGSDMCNAADRLGQQVSLALLLALSALLTWHLV